MSNKKKLTTNSTNHKNQSPLLSSNQSEKDEFKRLIFLITIIAVVAIVFYLIAVVVSNKRNQLKYKETTEKSQIEYDQILGSDIFNQGQDYYVLVLKKENEFETLFNSYITTYKKKDDHLMIYKVDLGNVFNQNYLGEENHFESNAFQTNDNALLRIQNGNVVESYTGNEVIVEKMYKLGKTEES